MTIIRERDDIMSDTKRSSMPRRFGGMLAPVAAVWFALACDTTVTNPGGAQDAFLDSLSAHQAVVTGARRDLADAMDNITYWAAAMTFEVNPAGSTGSFGIPSYIQAGRFDNDDTGDWNAAQRARWTAENAFVRFERVLPEIQGAPTISSYGPAAEALMYAGFANRLLGENFCQVTFDGGGLEPHTNAFVRAEGYFTQAMAIASAAGNSTVETAARGGRASVRANLATYGMGSWTDAAADAASVPDDFVFEMVYSEQDQDQHNRIMFANGDEPYRAHTTWGTYWENMPDPRTPFTITTMTGDAGVEKFGGNVPWYPQQKFPDRDSGVPMTSGWEMRLIRAEAALVANDLVEAAAQMNVRRADLSLPDVGPFATLAEAYTALKTERAAELWLEGRRMHDVRRWMENNVPGDYVDGNYRDASQANQFPNKVEDLTSRARAYFVGNSEVETNPNVSDNPGCS